MILFKQILSVFIGFSTGIVISGAVFAFITVLGVVPRLAQKTKTESYIMLYEEAIILGGISGCIMSLYNPYIPIGKIATLILSLLIGLFYGCLTVSLAEFLKVIPILTRRLKIQDGMLYFMLSLALGKLVGALLYFLVPGYYH